jgi:hypothetical protein
MKERRLHIDSRSRISIAAFIPKGMQISSLKAYQEGDRIILEPMAEIPARELWLHQNKDAMASLDKGLEDAEAGKVHDLGSFAQFADDELEIE